MDRQGLRVIPRGIYTLELREQEAKVTRHEDARHREFIQLTWDVVDGPYASFRLYDNLVTSVAAAARIAQYAEAFGIGDDWDAAMEFLRTIHQYVGHRIRAHVQERAYQGQSFMVVGRVFPLEG